MNRALPRNVHLKDGRYYFVRTDRGRQKWIPMTRELTSSLSMAEEIRAAAGGQRDTDGLLRCLRRSFTSARWRASKYGVEFTIDWATIRATAQEQGWTCSLTGIPFALGAAPHARQARPLAPSIDRVSCKAGYVDRNVRLISVAMNYALNEWGEDFFEHIAAAFVLARGSKTLRQPQSSLKAENQGQNVCP